MDASTDIYCATCFAMPGEPCVEKYLAHPDGVTPVPCATHGTRIAGSDRAQFFLSQKAPQ